MSLFSFLLFNVFVAASKPTAQRNKTGFILYALKSPPINSRIKNKTSFDFIFYYIIYIGLISPIKNIKQNIRENVANYANFPPNF